MLAEVGKPIANTGFEPGSGPVFGGFLEAYRGCRARHQFFGSGSTTCSLAGHRLRYVCRARLPVGHARRVLGFGFAISGRACDVYTRRFLCPAGVPHAVADPARQFTIYDTTRPYELRFDDSFSQTILQMPRKLLQQRIGAFDMLTATTFSSDRPLESLVYEFLVGMSKTIDHVDPVTATRLLDQALDLVAMAFADRMRQRSPDQSSHRSALLYRLNNYILTHLRDPELSMPRAAAAIGISPRYASDLMAAEQTSFRSYVQVQRLERCRRDLSDPAHAARHISDIAFAWGFNDLAHFSRIFKQRFGASPREWREHPTQ